MFKVVVFDFDGVIADSEQIALEELAAEMAARGAPVNYEDARHLFLGASTQQHMAFISERSGMPCQPDFPDAWHARLYARYRHALKAVPGSIKTLDWLVGNQIPYCIASGGSPDRIQTALEILSLTAYFQNRAFSADMVKAGKPAPDLFLLAAEKMAVSPSDCVVIEDAVAGVQGAVSAGMKAIGFTGGLHLIGQSKMDQAQRLKAAGASFVFDTHERIRDYLKKGQLKSK